MLLNELLDLQRDLNRVFNWDYHPRSTIQRNRFPGMNIFEKGNSVLVKAEVPGIDKKDIKVSLKDNVLTVSGERKITPKVDGTYHRRERDQGSFERMVELPIRVDPEKVSADLNDGLLSVWLEKAEEAKGREITIN